MIKNGNMFEILFMYNIIIASKVNLVIHLKFFFNNKPIF